MILFALELGVLSRCLKAQYFIQEFISHDYIRHDGAGYMIGKEIYYSHNDEFMPLIAYKEYAIEYSNHLVDII
jgi:hypothetical protein